MIRSYALAAACCTIISLIASGCSQTEAQPILPSQVQPPATFTKEQRTWDHSPQIQSADDDLFARFLKAQPEWAGSPSIAGTPVLYRCGKDRRFYWLEGSGSNATWTCLAWEQGRFSVSEGAGLPFPDSQPASSSNPGNG